MKASAKEGSKQTLPLHLPHIVPSRSLPAIRPLREFDLRCVNLPMKSYDPSNDKFLSQFFQRQNRIRALSTEAHQKSLKTQPSSLERKGSAVQAGRKERKQKVLLTEQSRTQAVKELSRQDFNSFLQTMRQRVASKRPK